MNFKKYLENDEKCHKIHLNDDERVHTTHNPDLSIETLKDMSHVQKNDWKPRGFWYSCGEEWIKWCQGENFRIENLKHKYILNLDFSSILKITNYDEFDIFDEKYSKLRISGESAPDWHLVSLDYAGIEICPYQWRNRTKHLWYYGWDVASGCVWSKSAIKDIIKIY